MVISCRSVQPDDSARRAVVQMTRGANNAAAKSPVARVTGGEQNDTRGAKASRVGRDGRKAGQGDLRSTTHKRASRWVHDRVLRCSIEIAGEHVFCWHQLRYRGSGYVGVIIAMWC